MTKINFLIRAFDHDDLEQVKVMIHKTIRFCYPLNYSYDVIEFFINYHSRSKILHDAGEGYTLVAFENEKVIGTGNLSGNEIKGVYVDPRYQKAGIGKAIMDKLLEKAIENKVKKIFLDSTLNAKKFYDSLGFVTVEKKTTIVKNSNLDYFRMEKEL